MTYVEKCELEMLAAIEENHKRAEEMVVDALLKLYNEKGEKKYV